MRLAFSRLLAVFLLGVTLSSSVTADDDDHQYTNIGQIGLTVSNFGTIGTRNAYWPNQPSCEYPRGSRIEHMYQGGLWIGAYSRANARFLVSTGASDQAFRSSTSGITGFEFTNDPGAHIVRRSSLATSPDFTPSAVSHQDFVADFADLYRRVPATGDTINEHSPLQVTVHEESYAWNYPFADFFVILSYTIRNVSTDTFDSVYVGLWTNPVVRNTNLVRPGTGGYFEHGAAGYDSLVRMMYGFDYDGIPGERPADSYIGLKLLGTTPFPPGVDSVGNLRKNTYFNAWRYRSNIGEQAYFSPTDDQHPDRYLSRYSRLAQSLPQNYIDALRLPPPQGVAPINATYLLSVGPLCGEGPSGIHNSLYPGDSVNVCLAVTCAKKEGSAHARSDTREQRRTLYAHADWAQRAYNGEDVNGNNILDPGEDIVARIDTLGLVYQPDGKLTRFLLPFPPREPKVRAVVENQKVTLYWDKASSEESVDPISGQIDFEGYRIYRTNAGADFQSPETFLLNMSLVGEFDVPGNHVGHNTGFSQILLDSAIAFERDSIRCYPDSIGNTRCDTTYATRYWYRFPPKGVEITHLNGWQYVYGISAFDRGDSANGLPSLECAKVLKRVIPGTPPTSNPSVEVRVYPNPYYASSYWDGRGERNRKIYFYNLPARCEIRIYTLAGDVVTELDHDAGSYTGSDIQWFQTHGDAQTVPNLAGGEHAWDLITRFDQAIASGLYLFTVKDKDNGNIKRGKFLIIK